VNSFDVLGGIAPEQVRVRFPPSPTGNLHVGNVRSALFNWVFARHYGGTFVLRIEDTDAARNLDAAYDVVYDSLNWLGLTWDEGPGVGGPYGPYLQTERLDTYAGIVPQLLGSHSAYRCYCSREEIEAREAQRPKGAPSGYDGFCRTLSAETIAEHERGGTPFVVRMRVGEDPITFHDLVRGEVTFEPTHSIFEPVDGSNVNVFAPAVGVAFSVTACAAPVTALSLFFAGSSQPSASAPTRRGAKRNALFILGACSFTCSC